MYNERLALGRNRAAHAYKQKERYNIWIQMKLSWQMWYWQYLDVLFCLHLFICLFVFFPKEIEHIDIR